MTISNEKKRLKQKPGNNDTDHPLARDVNETVNERVQQDPAFARALLTEAMSLLVNNEPETARLVLRDIVNATLGFERLAVQLAKPSKSLHRMLSAKGNPTMDNLTAIVDILCKTLQVTVQFQTTQRIEARYSL
ncbi:MAG: transcriptional regulator [Methylovulum sp.]|nr:transcriptional regulator [Methylovulum sp.]